MKRIIYFVLAILVCGIYVGCSENEIDLYDQTPRINFYGSTTHVRTLVDTDYVKIDDPYAVDSFTVRIQGDLLKENRDFCVKVTPNSDYQNSVDVLLESKYTYTELDTVCQVFYYKTSERGKRLAEILQRRFDYVLGEKNTRLAKPNGSYYLLLHVKQPIVIVECGFLSNWKEAANLNSGEYQDRLAWTIHVGIMEFLNQKKSS